MCRDDDRSDRIADLESQIILLHVTLTYIINVVETANRELLDPATFGRIKEAERKAYAVLNHGAAHPIRDALLTAADLLSALEAKGIRSPETKRLADFLNKIDWVIKTLKKAG